MINEQKLKDLFLDGNDQVISIENLQDKFLEMRNLFMVYECAIKEVKTKLEILDSEFKVNSERNPIEYMKSRVKSPESIINKLIKKGEKLNTSSIKENLNDIAGIRVVCSFIEDIYHIADMLKNQNDITLIKEKDYIKNPKSNGYRSLHLVLEIPVFFSKNVEHIRVEVQIRTIAMDFWASLEHKLYYKSIGNVQNEMSYELKECADIISSTDERMQEIQKRVEKL
ncbi:MAG: GTP pyrophosphokinase family protein [Clostridium sp.]|nr:GTP pyrophosphokinase family protein [Clostridium sp.]